ncbi:MaoC family dehydratase [Frankia nepalensis]
MSRRMGSWFEELSVGTVTHHAITRTLTETDNVIFTTMSMNPQPLHLDHEFASRTEFGRPLVNSLLTLATVVGLSVPELTLGTTVANLGFASIEFPHPVFAGDTVHVVTEVTKARLSKSRPSVGIVEFRHDGYNQRDELVCRAFRSAMMHCRPAEA